MHPIKIIFRNQMSLLAFKKFKPNIPKHGNWYLLFGFITAWLAGIGRYWDNPKAELWQYLGLGSVLYCLFLAAIVYVILYPLKPKNWEYTNILIFILLTSLPALLYAIPVERFTSLEVSQTLNVAFLAIVALWRIVLFGLYLKRSAGLSGFEIFVGVLLPIVLIINVLTFLNLEHVVFRIMAGLKENERSANDSAYQVLYLITVLSYLLLPFILIIYSRIVYLKRQKT